jgi:hypothetical protein
MRTTIAFIFMVLMAALVGCAVVASRVEKPIAVPVRRLLLALLPPVFGNFLIILSGEPMLATIGCYTYYIGMDVMMMALFYFTSDYCNLGLSKSKLSAVCDVAIRVPETETYKVQELHLPVYHALCAAIEEEMF